MPIISNDRKFASRFHIIFVNNLYLVPTYRMVQYMFNCYKFTIVKLKYIIFNTFLTSNFVKRKLNDDFFTIYYIYIILYNV